MVPSLLHFSITESEIVEYGIARLSVKYAVAAAPDFVAFSDIKDQLESIIEELHVEEVHLAVFPL